MQTGQFAEELRNAVSLGVCVLTHPPQSAIVSVWAVSVKGESQAQRSWESASSPGRNRAWWGGLRWVELVQAEVGGAGTV